MDDEQEEPQRNGTGEAEDGRGRWKEEDGGQRANSTWEAEALVGWPVR